MISCSVVAVVDRNIMVVPSNVGCSMLFLVKSPTCITVELLSAEIAQVVRWTFTQVFARWAWLPDADRLKKFESPASIFMLRPAERQLHDVYCMYKSSSEAFGVISWIHMYLPTNT